MCSVAIKNSFGHSYLYDFSLINSQPLTKAEEAQLFKRIKAGDRQAVDRLIESNLRFVVDTAKCYHHKPLAEIISDGIVGLIRAIDKFDTNKNVRFLSYAVWWIRQSIMFNMYNDTLIKISSKTIKEIFKQDRNKKTDKFTKARMIAGESALRCYSTDYLLKNDNGNSRYLADTIKDKYDVQDDIIQKELEEKSKQFLMKALKKFSRRDRYILLHRLGLFGKKKLTLKFLGNKFGISKERVRQIQNHLIGVLRKKIKEELCSKSIK